MKSKDIVFINLEIEGPSRGKGVLGGRCLGRGGHSAACLSTRGEQNGQCLYSVCLLLEKLPLNPRP